MRHLFAILCCILSSDSLVAVMITLHWPPVRLRVNYDVAWCLCSSRCWVRHRKNIVVDVYLVADSDLGLPRSASDRTCVVHVHITPLAIIKSFAVASQWVWNDLLSYIPQDFSYTDNSNGNWKRFCLELTDHGASWLFAHLRLRNTLTYLLTYLLACLHFLSLRERVGHDVRSHHSVEL